MPRFNHMPGLRTPSPAQSRIMDVAADLARRFDARVAGSDGISRFPIEHCAGPHQSGYPRLALPVVHGGEGEDVFTMTKSLPLERYFRDTGGGLFQPAQDDLH
jgi:hypothetical protein